MAQTNRRAFLRFLPVTGALAAAAATALIVLLLSRPALESFAWNTGIAGLVPAAAPPLGRTARLLLAVGLAAFVGAVAWSALFLLWGPGGLLAPRRRDPDTVSVRRADAHPDAPPRRPISAESDFGAPAAPPPLERTLPVDLERPLADYDPAAIPPVPQAPSEPVRPLAKLPSAPDRAERIDTFALTPPAAATEPPPPPAPPATIESLLRRLEEGAVRRAARERD